MKEEFETTFKIATLHLPLNTPSVIAAAGNLPDYIVEVDKRS